MCSIIKLLNAVVPEACVSLIFECTGPILEPPNHYYLRKATSLLQGLQLNISMDTESNTNTNTNTDTDTDTGTNTKTVTVLPHRVCQLVADYAVDDNLFLRMVMDIDGTLIGEYDDRTGQRRPRPGIERFLSHATAMWGSSRMAVWTAASKGHMDASIALLKERVSKLSFAFTWHGNRCSLIPLNSARGEYYREDRAKEKRMSKIWDTKRLKSAGWRQHNTILLDNTARVARTCRGNLLLVNTFEGAGEKNEEDFNDWVDLVEKVTTLQLRLFHTGTVRAALGQLPEVDVDVAF